MHLQVLLGRERGRVYTLEGGSYVAGRGSDCDVILASNLVSRRNTSIVVGQSEMKVADQGSSNGTFINGARVLGEGVVALGAVLMIGNVAMRLHGGTPPPIQQMPFFDGGSRPEIDPNNPLPTLSGSLIEIPPSTILRYLGVAKSDGVLLLTSPPLQSRISFARGHVSEVIVDTRKTRDPVQALTAILRWKGTFELGPPEEVAAGSTLLLGLDAVLPAVGSQARPSVLPKPR
jgi:hypothetical protein